MLVDELVDEPTVDALAGYPVQGAVVGVGVHAPVATVGKVGHPRREEVAEEAEAPEDQLGHPAGVSHDMMGVQ